MATATEEEQKDKDVDIYSVETTDRTLFGKMKSYTGGKNWLALSKSNIPEDQLYNDLQTYQSLVATLSGLITGFSYVVLSEPIMEYEEDKFLGSDRANVQAGFTICAFMFAIFSVIVGSTLYGFAGFAGAKHVRIWMRKAHKIIDIPTMTLAISITSMLVGAWIHIGGLYNNVLYYTVLCFSIILVLMYFVINYIMMIDQWEFLDNCEQYNEKD
eukprot:232336_1